jgi:small subunit ribosomal protein S21
VLRSAAPIRMPIKVQIRPNESLESALKRFKRQCNSSGVFRLAKAHSWYEKRSDRLRRERRERIRTIQRAGRRIGRERAPMF